MPEVNYVWDPIEDNVIRERDENGNTLVDYTTRPSLYGSVLSQDCGGEVRHYHFDGQGNTTELTDENGIVTDTRRYSAFGGVTESTGTTEFPFLWGTSRGLYFDKELSIFSARRVEYSAVTGSILSAPRNIEPPLPPGVPGPFAPTTPFAVPRTNPTPPGPVPLPIPLPPIDPPVDLSELMKRQCKCQASKKQISAIPVESAGIVICVNGFFRVLPWPNTFGEHPPLADKCGETACIYRHESYHIEQMKMLCHTTCKNKTCDPDVWWGQPSVWVVEFAGPNNICQPLIECPAYKVEFDCLIRKYLMAKADGDTECATYLLKVLTNKSNNVKRDLKCKGLPAVPP